MLISGLFLAVPCFLRASPLDRFVLMVCTAFIFVIATALLLAPQDASFRGRLAFFFSWLGTRNIYRRKRRFDLGSFFRLIAATVVLAAGLVCLRTVSATGPSILLRWFAGGFVALAFAEMVTASHDWLKALAGVSAPALMRSPFLSTSVNEFWTKRWNVAASQMGFRPLFFTPVARYSVVLALFSAFFASAVAHALLAFMATERWRISLLCGAFFMVQPLLILAERILDLRRWPMTARRVWTLTTLGLTSPLFVEPMLQVIGPPLAAADNVLTPTIVTIGVALAVNLVLLSGQLAFCVKRPPVQSNRLRSGF